MSNEMKKQSGFTLIELIMVIVILGILAATALPKFVNIKGDAETSAITGVAGSVSSAFVTNYSGYLINTAKGASISGAQVNVANAVGSVMGGAGLPAGYTATAAAATVACGSVAGTGGSAGVAVPITISSASTTTPTAAATLICTG